MYTAYTSSDYRSIARIALRGKWIPAAVTAFTASMIGATITAGGSSGFQIEEGELDQFMRNYSSDELHTITVFLSVFAAFTVIRAMLAFIVGGAGQLGYARYNLGLVDGANVQISDLFSQFHRIGAGFLMVLLQGIYLFFWSFLFVIPGIIKSFSYAMTPYILSEHPEYGVNDAITESRRIMDGSKFDLFCLHLSFIGWSLLASLPAVIGITGVLFGSLPLSALILLTVIADAFLYAYMEAANAAFYRDISKQAAQYTGSDSTEWNG
jgi:uncharacterized membrane protein